MIPIVLLAFLQVLTGVHTGVHGGNAQRTVQVHVIGTGTGIVSSSPVGILCAVGSTCSHQFPLNTSVVLSATPSGGPNAFFGWTAGTGNASGCSGTGTCAFTLTSPTSVTAEIDLNTVTADQFVATNGNDTWDGTADHHVSGTVGPVADICTAAANVNTLFPLPRSKNVLVSVRGGSYVSSTNCTYPIAFTTAHSGTDSDHTVSYQNYPSEVPVIDGRQRVTGWSVSTTGLCSQRAAGSTCYSVSLNPASWNYFEGMWVNGVRRFNPRLGAGLSYTLTTCTTAGSAAKSLMTCNTSGTNALAPASFVVVSGVSGGSGYNITCNVKTVTSTSFSCYSNGSSGAGLGGTVTVDNRGQYYRINSTCANACSSFTATTGDPLFSTWNNFTITNPAGHSDPTSDIRLTFWQHWVASTARLASISACTNPCAHTVTFTATMGNGTQPVELGHRYIVENVEDLFGQPGQWFLDRKTSSSTWTLYYVAQAGDVDPNTDVVLVPQSPIATPTVMTLTGTEWVNFQGITFSGDNATVPQAGYDDAQLNVNATNAISCSNCQNDQWSGDTFQQTMGAAIGFLYTSPAQHCALATDTGCITLSGNIFKDLGANGIRIGPKPNPTTTEAQVPADFTITNNYAVGWGMIHNGSSFLTTGLLNSSIITNNTGHDGYQKFMELCMPTPSCGGTNNLGFHHNTIQDNYCWGIGKGITNDNACYYLVNALPSGAGLGNVVKHNFGAFDTDAGQIDTTGPTPGYGGQIFYFDQASGGVDAENNVAIAWTSTAYNLTQSTNTNSACTPFTHCGNYYKNNIAVDTVAGGSFLGVSSCPLTPPPPAVPGYLQQFQSISNLFYARITGAIIQKKSGAYLGTSANLATDVQNWANNKYFSTATNWSTGTPFVWYSTNTQSGAHFNCSGPTNISFATWQAGPTGGTGGEDSGSLISDPGFVQPYCTLATPAACIADPLQYNLSLGGVSPTPGVSPVPIGGTGITLSGWGSSLADPGTPIDMYPILLLNPSVAYCTTCP